jgi:hypothetical protein
MKIVFDTPKEVVVVKELKMTVSELTINEITDNADRKIVAVSTKELGQIVLWEGDAYDAIGQWTDTDVIARVNDLLK